MTKELLKAPKWEDLPYFDLPSDWLKEHCSPADPDHFHRCPPDGKTFRDCLLWQKACNSDGYGIIWVPLRLAASVLDVSKYVPGARVCVRVIILMWEQHNRCKVEKGFLIHHKCHVEDKCAVRPARDCIHRKCGEYSHLGERTHSQNRNYIVSEPQQSTQQPTQKKEKKRRSGVDVASVKVPGLTPNSEYLEKVEEATGLEAPGMLKGAAWMADFGLAEKYYDEHVGSYADGSSRYAPHEKDEPPKISVITSFHDSERSKWEASRREHPYDVRHFPDREGDRVFDNCGYGGWCGRTVVHVFTCELGWVVFDDVTFEPHEHVFGLAEQVREMMADDPVRTSKWWHWAFDGAVSQVDVYVEREKDSLPALVGPSAVKRKWWHLR